jgi:hypothetical protein
MQVQCSVFKPHSIQTKKQKQEFKSGSMREPLVITPAETKCLLKGKPYAQLIINYRNDWIHA